MTLIEEIERGIAGKNVGLNIGLPKLNSVLGGLQKKTSIAVGAEKKVGKTGYVDSMFVLSPYLLNPNDNIHWKYFSFEIDRISKEAKYAAFFMQHDYQISIDDNYILGKKVLPSGDRVIITPEHKEKIHIIYEKRIIPLFGEYTIQGTKIKEGVMDFIEDRINPTGLRNYLMNYAKEHGEFIYEPYFTEEGGKKVKKERLMGYRENDESLYTIIIVDHIRNLSKERGFSMKENIDKMSEYAVFLRNIFKFSFIFVSHLNRGLADVDRMKYMKDSIFPTAEDFKDSGNLAEDCTHVLTLFNPVDDKYHLATHFGRDLTPYKYSNNYRSMHLTDSRHAPCPLHLATTFEGGNLTIKEI